MRHRIATISLLISLIACSGRAEPGGFKEQFALADEAGRERLLQELVAGTEDHDYFHCLHYQNTRKTTALQRTLAAWKKRAPGQNERRTKIELREAVLNYVKDPQGSLQVLRDHFALDLEEIAPPPDAETAANDLPSKLDPQEISAEAFMTEAFGGIDPGRYLDAETAAWLISSGREIPAGLDRRQILQAIDRPDVPKLLAAIIADLGKDNRGRFGSLKIHEQLTVAQLDQLATEIPSLLNVSQFSQTYLRKLRPGPMDPGDEVARTEAFLKRAWRFAEKLPPSMGAVQAKLLRHWLSIDLQRGEIDRGRLLSYLKLPRRGGYMNREFLQEAEHVFELGTDLEAATGLPTLGNDDEALMRGLFLTLFQENGDYQPYTRYIHSGWLREVSAEAQILTGKGDREKLASAISPARYQEIVDRVEVQIAPDNRRHQAVDEATTIAVDIKNVPKLTVKVFEINALNYFLETGRDLDLSLDLDGLIASDEEVYEFDSPPALRVRHQFTFPQLAGRRGAWLIEFVGNGTSSRALIRKGELHAIPGTTAAGQIFRIFDGDRRRVRGASLWLGGHEFHADEQSGDILVPFSTSPGRSPIVITDGELAVLDHFDHESENYELEAAMFVDRESLIAGNTAQLIVRPQLTINGHPAGLGLLRDAALVITSTDRDGTRSVERVEGIKLSSAREFVHAFAVPERLDELEVRIEADIESLSTGKRVRLSDDMGFSLNAIDYSYLIHSAHVTKSGDDYLVEVLGKSGERQPGKVVAVSFQHQLFGNTIVLRFRSDEEGQVFLGKLPGIDWIKTEVDENMDIGVPLGAMDRTHLAGPNLHLASGQGATLPSVAGSLMLDRQNYSFLEMRGGVPSRDRFASLSAGADGSLRIAGQPPGEYLLRTPDGKIQVLVSADRPGAILSSSEQFLEPSRELAQLALELGDPAGGKLRIRLQNHSKHTRVHVLASRFVPRFHFNYALATGGRGPAPRAVDIARARNTYLSGREIGDEYRYILERRDRPKFPGNQLPRPGLLLNPWDLGLSRSGEDFGAGGGDSFDAERRRRLTGAMPGSDEPEYLYEESYLNLDFLTPRRRSFYNLQPDEDGVVEIDLAQLGSARYIRALAIDGDRHASRNRALPLVRLQTRDLRLKKPQQLDPRGRFTRAREVQVLRAGEALTIARADATRFQVYDDLTDVFALLSALNPAGADGTLEKFSFITSWPELGADDKRRYYSDYASHELNLFLSRRDPAFFGEVVRPFLQNKREKDFIDHYLLGGDLSPYLDEWRLRRLNAAERALLARSLEGEARERCIRGLKDLHEAKPSDHVVQQRLFKVALAGHDLSTADEALAFNRALEESLFPEVPAEDASSAGVPYIRRKLKQIIIPEIDFTDTTIEEAIAFLRQQARKHDVEGAGVNMVIRPAVSDPELRTDVARINLQLTDVPLEDALKFTTQLAGLNFKVEPLAVVILPLYDLSGSLLTQTFRVPADFFDRFQGKGNQAKQVLMEAGIPFAEGASATFLPRTSTLVVRNTESSLDLVEVIVESIVEAPPEEGREMGFGGTNFDDPFAGGADFSAGAAPDDPFGGEPTRDGRRRKMLSEVDEAWEFTVQSGRRQNVRQFYRQLGDTEELAETHYYRVKNADQEADLIPANAFWQDFASWDGDGEFLSTNFPAAHSNPSEILMVLAVLDLPFGSKPVKIQQQGNELKLSAAQSKIVFVETIRESELAEGEVVIGQSYFPLRQPTRLEQGESVPNYVDDQFIIGTAYGSNVVATNPTGRPIEFDVLRQLPQGAIPLKGSRMTDSTPVRLAPFSTTNFTMGFYFPMAGKFTQYPAQASAAGKVVASTAGKTFQVSAARGEVDASSWDDLARRGGQAPLLAFLRSENLHHYPLEDIAWRMVDKAFFTEVIEVLRERQVYHHELYSFGLAHDHPHAIEQFLLNSGSFLSQIGRVIDSELLRVSPAERRLYQHLEYEPLVNARHHQLAGEPRIVNDRLRVQHDRLTDLLVHQAAPDDDDRLSIVYYLLLQDRVAEAIDFFDTIAPGKLSTRIQYDYFRAYLAFYREDARLALKIAVAYQNHPVERWRQLFTQVVSQANEALGGEAAPGDNPRDREIQQEQLASTSPHLDLEIDAQEVAVSHRNLETATLNFYHMDLEFLFSANPFVESDTSRFRYVKPNHSQVLAFGKADAVERVPLPGALRSGNFLVEVVGGGQNKSLAHFSNRLALTITPNYGRLRVAHTDTGKPLPKTYIKVFARMPGGEVKFFKDGYTDLRGKFDYASISADELEIEDVERFAILVMHDQWGAVVKEVDGPFGGGQAALNRTRPSVPPAPEPAPETPPEPPVEEAEDPFDF